MINSLRNSFFFQQKFSWLGVNRKGCDLFYFVDRLLHCVRNDEIDDCVRNDE